MAEIKTIKTDVVVIGAGIAGLWLANILKNNGINFVLLETDAIGANQTINSQGMLHSGIKYALQGNVTGDMKAISDSEALHLWEQAFLDQSSIKLTENCKLIDHQYLWSNNQLTSKLANFFVSNLLKSKVEKVAPEHLPVPFINKHFNGSVYKLHETVLNLSVLLQELTAPIYQYCLQVNNINLELEVNNNKINKFFIDVNGERFLLNSQQYIFTAGEGIQKISSLLKDGPKMQVRPLHMVAVKGKFLPMLYGHNIGLQSKPIITISSHKTTRDQVVWYCGGQIAEDGVNKSSTEQLAAFKELLNSIFPWLDFNDPDYAWGSFNINRAEHLQPNGKKPDNATWFALNNVIFAWPTKLVLAPAMANDIFGSLQKNLSLNLQDKSSNVNVDFLGKLPKPMIAKPWWASL